VMWSEAFLLDQEII